MYHKFTNEEIETAHKTDLVRFLKARGETVSNKYGHNYWFYDGESICITGNLWFNFYTREGGEAIKFVREFFNKSFPEAIAMLLDVPCTSILRSEIKPETNKSFMLPEANETNNRVISYLTKTRGIDEGVVNAFIDKGLIYEQAQYHNVVFIGTDKQGVPRHAHIRGTGINSTFKMSAAGSSNEYSFHWDGSDDEIFLFEAPIDMLSYITLHPNDWSKHSYVAACSVSDRALHQCLKDNPHIKTVHICFDNDKTGQCASLRVFAQVIKKCYTVDVLIPYRKDWNEDVKCM